MPRLVLGASFVLASFAWGCTSNDQFVCGVRAASGDKANVCDAANELCVCADHRCARFDSSCASQYRYSFQMDGDRECVDPSLTYSFLVQTGAATEDQFCPGDGGLPPACGVVVDGATKKCPANELCFCSRKQCVREEKTLCAESGYAWSFDSTCVEAPVDLASELPDRFTLLCDDQTPPPVYPEDCGKPTPDGAAITCGTNRICVCANNQCAEPLPTTLCPSGLRYVRSGDCVAEADAAPGGVSTTFCPGWQLPASIGTP